MATKVKRANPEQSALAQWKARLLVLRGASVKDACAETGAISNSVHAALSRNRGLYPATCVCCGSGISNPEILQLDLLNAKGLKIQKENIK
jgi:hypothetical protein